MSLSQSRKAGLLPDDIEFCTLEDDIEIIPSFKLPVFDSLDGRTSYGPLNPPQRATVPLWMAVHLKKKKKCRIVVPSWMVVSELEQTAKDESLSEMAFSPLPSHFFEVSKTLLQVAPDDIPSPDQVRTLLKEIREIRQSKVRAGLQALNPIHLAMPDLSTMEITEIKPFFSLAFKRLRLLDPDFERRNEISALWLENPNEALRNAQMGLYGIQEYTGDVNGEQDEPDFF